MRSAGELPFFGPNCYGFINFFDGVALWPDQVVGAPASSAAWRSSAKAARSRSTCCSTTARLPIGYVLTVGNQTRLAVEDLIELLVDDERVTAFGLYLEGIKDVARFAAAAAKARAAGKPIALVKTGRTAGGGATPRIPTPAPWPAPTAPSMPSADRPASPAASRSRRCARR